MFNRHFSRPGDTDPYEDMMILIENIWCVSYSRVSTAQCPRCQLGIALNRARSDQSQIVDFVI